VRRAGPKPDARLLVSAGELFADHGGQRGRIQDGAQPDRPIGQQSGLHPAEDERADALLAEQRPIAVGAQAQPLTGDERLSTPSRSFTLATLRSCDPARCMAVFAKSPLWIDNRIGLNGRSLRRFRRGLTTHENSREQVRHRMLHCMARPSRE
jgi:hypothetical protein